MGLPTAQPYSAKVKRGPLQAKCGPRHNSKANPIYKLWTDLIAHAVQDAKRTVQGLPTDSAILARWWIAEHQPKQADKDEWERSFECACEWLDRETAAYRKELLEEIDSALMLQYEEHVQAVIYVRRAMVLSCAGMPTAIARQFVLPLVSKKDYEDVAGVDHGDKYVMYDRPEPQAA